MAKAFRTLLEQHFGSVRDSDVSAVMEFATTQLQGRGQQDAPGMPKKEATSSRSLETGREVGKWKQELITAWTAWFNAEGGRHRGNTEQLQVFLTRQLPRSLAIRVEDRQNIAMITIQDQNKTYVYGVPANHDYQEAAPNFAPDRDASIFERIKSLDLPAVFDEQQRLLQKGKVSLS